MQGEILYTSDSVLRTSVRAGSDEGCVQDALLFCLIAEQDIVYTVTNAIPSMTLTSVVEVHLLQEGVSTEVLSLLGCLFGKGNLALQTQRRDLSD